jgi:hypothetical protein
VLPLDLIDASVCKCGLPFNCRKRVGSNRRLIDKSASGTKTLLEHQKRISKEDAA